VKDIVHKLIFVNCFYGAKICTKGPVTCTNKCNGVVSVTMGEVLLVSVWYMVYLCDCELKSMVVIQ